MVGPVQLEIAGVSEKESKRIINELHDKNTRQIETKVLPPGSKHECFQFINKDHIMLATVIATAAKKEPEPTDILNKDNNRPNVPVPEVKIDQVMNGKEEGS